MPSAFRLPVTLVGVEAASVIAATLRTTARRPERSVTRFGPTPQRTSRS